jgi:hypothetical protein
MKGCAAAALVLGPDLPLVGQNDGARNGKPDPMPWSLVVKKGSNTWVSLSDGMPGPESEIEITADDPPFSSVRPITVRP